MDWLCKNWLELLRALGPLIIGAVVAYIAYQQWKVNRTTLREKLFDRRFAVFEQTRDFLGSILQSATLDDDALAAYWSAPQMAKFLFDSEMSNYLDEIRDRAFGMRHWRNQYETLPVGKERSELVDRATTELKWLTDQVDQLYPKFQPYLQFDTKN